MKKHLILSFALISSTSIFAMQQQAPEDLPHFPAIAAIGDSITRATTVAEVQQLQQNISDLALILPQPTTGGMHPMIQSLHNTANGRLTQIMSHNNRSAAQRQARRMLFPIDDNNN